MEHRRIDEPDASPRPGSLAPAARLRGILLILVVALAVLGMVDGWYLTMVHVDYELSPGSALRQVCGALAANGCAVTTGRFGDMFGIPVSVIGLGGAAATAVTAAIAWRHRGAEHDRWRSTALVLSIISVLASMVMGTLSSIEGSFCPFCVAWYGLNLTMGLCALSAWRLGERSSAARLVLDALGSPGLVAVAALTLGLSLGHWGYSQRRSQALNELANAALDRILKDDKPVALELAGFPSEGPADAPITVVELADFECPFCLDLWMGVREYAEQAPFEVRVVFLHFPLDDSCNPGVRSIHTTSCAAARAAECARRHDAFFAYGDLLFEHQPVLDPDDFIGFARELGLPEDEFRACLDDEQVDLEIHRSITRARGLGVQTTPTFFVNGYKFSGSRDPKWIRVVFDALARRAKQVGELG